LDKNYLLVFIFLRKPLAIIRDSSKTVRETPKIPSIFRVNYFINVRIKSKQLRRPKPLQRRKPDEVTRLLLILSDRRCRQYAITKAVWIDDQGFQKASSFLKVNISRWFTRLNPNRPKSSITYASSRLFTCSSLGGLPKYTQIMPPGFSARLHSCSVL